MTADTTTDGAVLTLDDPVQPAIRKVATIAIASRGLECICADVSGRPSESARWFAGRTRLAGVAPGPRVAPLPSELSSHHDTFPAWHDEGSPRIDDASRIPLASQDGRYGVLEAPWVLVPASDRRGALIAARAGVAAWLGVPIDAFGLEF